MGRGHDTTLEGLAYAGVGSRKTPEEVRGWMERIGEALGRAGMVLRSGAAVGADQAFERGCDRAGGRKEIYLPEPGYNGYEPDGVSIFPAPKPWAVTIAKEKHPAWHRLGRMGSLLMSRNSHQVHGWEMPGANSVVVIGWTPGGNGMGGTGQAYRIARDRRVEIPVIELARGGVYPRHAPAAVVALVQACKEPGA